MQESSQNAKKKSLYLNNGCSRDMRGNAQCFISFKKTEGWLVTFGYNYKWKIKGKDIFGKKDFAKINDVEYVEGLKHNLLSISQLCDCGFEVIFKPNICEVKPTSFGKKFLH